MLVAGQFNLENFDKKLIKTLVSTTSNCSEISFENMNCITTEDIKSFELIFFDRYIDTGENDLVAFSIYPNRKLFQHKPPLGRGGMCWNILHIP